MIGRDETNLFLGIINGWLVILVSAMFLCLMVYLNTIQKQFKLSWKEMLTDKQRQGLKLARPMIVFKLGMVLSFALAWEWRLVSSGADGNMSHWLFSFFLVSVFILTSGGLWLVRTLTVSRAGENVWIVTLMILILYLAINLFMYI